ncbi:MAG: nucleotide exchange factor GrpE, partial [Candidatus Omnitrophota bacterium]|nr:nucleotide exchange factor GrpE [Candidatus Omnitrophota bacterium]
KDKITMAENKNNSPEIKKTVTLQESEYLQLKEEAGKTREFQDKCLRLQADFENMRKRLQREKEDFLKFANEGLILELLVVLDDLERAVSLTETKHQDLPAFLKGVEMILAHLYEMLKENGVKSIEAKGKLFDPHLHEALMQVEDKAQPENTVIEELQKGYLLNDRVIRTAKVKVSRKQEVKNG